MPIALHKERIVPKEYEEVPGLYKIIPLQVLRRTAGVDFDTIPHNLLPRIDACDRVLHAPGAFSPGPVGGVRRPWYMHPCQDDNLVVLHGTRYVDIFTPAHGKIECFALTPNSVTRGDGTVYDGPAMLVWPKGVFHRVKSCEGEGSASLNLAVHYQGVDLKTNFNIYDLDPETGRYHVIREGHLDQPGGP